MHIEGPMDQWHLDLLKYQEKLFKKTVDEAKGRRDKLKEQLEKELDVVKFYGSIVLSIEEDIKEVREEIKKNYRTVSETYPNIPDVWKEI